MWLAPSAVSERTPCVYGIAPTRPATANLEADADSALLQAVVPGWRKIDDRHAATRGVSAAGCSYVWYRAAARPIPLCAPWVRSGLDRPGEAPPPSPHPAHHERN